MPLVPSPSFSYINCLSANTSHLENDAGISARMRQTLYYQSSRQRFSLRKPNMHPETHWVFSYFPQFYAPNFFHHQTTRVCSNLARPSCNSSIPSASFSLHPLQGKSLPEHFHRIGLATVTPYRDLALELANGSLPPLLDQFEWNLSYFKDGGSSFSEPVPFPIHDGFPESMLVFNVETMPKEGHSYPVIAIAASSNAWYAWISPWLLLARPFHLFWSGHRPTRCGTQRFFRSRPRGKRTLPYWH